MEIMRDRGDSGRSRPNGIESSPAEENDAQANPSAIDIGANFKGEVNEVWAVEPTANTVE